jgi:hypothetical protein
MGSGLYGGFLGDYYGSYSWNNFNPQPWYKDRLGWHIVTLKIYSIRMGVYITSFVLSFSIGKLISCFFKINKNYSLLFFLTLYLIILHTWPVFNSTSNAMRQGLSMSFMYLSLCAIYKNKDKKSIFFIILTYFLHIKTGIVFIFLYFIIKFLDLLNHSSLKKYNKIILLLTGLFFSVLTYLCMYFLDQKLEFSHRIIGNDFSLMFFILNVILIFLFNYRLNFIITSKLFKFAYLYSFLIISLYLMELSTQFERLHMVMLILNIFIVGLFIKKKQTAFFWLLSFSGLFFMTYYTGMFTILR